MTPRSLRKTFLGCKRGRERIYHCWYFTVNTLRKERSEAYGHDVICLKFSEGERNVKAILVKMQEEREEVVEYFRALEVWRRGLGSWDLHKKRTCLSSIPLEFIGESS